VNARGRELTDLEMRLARQGRELIGPQVAGDIGIADLEQQAPHRRVTDIADDDAPDRRHVSRRTRIGVQDQGFVRNVLADPERPAAGRVRAQPRITGIALGGVSFDLGAIHDRGHRRGQNTEHEARSHLRAPAYFDAMLVELAELTLDIVGAPAELIEDEYRCTIELHRAGQGEDDILGAQRMTGRKPCFGP